MPLFSIIIPTKARPQIIEHTLCSIKAQSFKDYEVIVTDDYDDKPCIDVFNKYRDNRFRYVNPPKSLKLGMCGNWEYGLQYATGKYIIFVQDKMYFYSDSLQYLYNFIKDHSFPDVINWNWDFYSFKDEEKNFSGVLAKRIWTNKYRKVDVKEEVFFKIGFAAHTYQNKFGAPGCGSPLCGAIKSDIYNIIKEKYGEVFNFFNPDYGPVIFVLDNAKEIYELDNHLTVMMELNNSEGNIHSRYYTAMRNFQEHSTCGSERLNYATVPGLYVTNANMVSADYNYALQISDNFYNYPKCNYKNVLISIYNEIYGVEYPSENEQNCEMDKFFSAVKYLATYERYGVVFNFKEKCKDIFLLAYKNVLSLLPNNFIFTIRKLKHRKTMIWKRFASPKESIYSLGVSSGLKQNM